MDEFVENFQKFREWLNSQNSSDPGIWERAMKEVKTKFDEYGLNDVF